MPVEAKVPVKDVLVDDIPVTEPAVTVQFNPEPSRLAVVAETVTVEPLYAGEPLVKVNDTNGSDGKSSQIA